MKGLSKNSIPRKIISVIIHILLPPPPPPHAKEKAGRKLILEWQGKPMMTKRDQIECMNLSLGSKGLNGDCHISFFVIRYRYRHFLNETIDIFIFSTASHKNSADKWQRQPLYGNIMVAVPVLETNSPVLGVTQYFFQFFISSWHHIENWYQPLHIQDYNPVSDSSKNRNV